MKIQNRKGQVLLIAVMLLATVITVVMTIAFNSTSETQVARLEADSQKALAAAEAGIDAVIKQSVNSTVDISSLGKYQEQKISGSARVLGVTRSYFVTPLIQKDEQYTFYLADSALSTPWNGSFSMSFVSEAGQCPDIEVSVVTSTYDQERYAYKTCSSIIQNAVSTANTTTVIDSVTFNYKTSDPILITNGLVAFVKVLGGRTKIGFQSSVDPNAPLPVQGKTVESEARTASGVVKKVQLFQSFPQIPSNFFMSSF